MDDLRITLNNGETQIPIWNQTTIPLTNCTLWGLFPTANTTYYLYWGNPDAESVWNQTAVFIDVVDGVVLGLPMDEGEGVITYDFSGYDNDGVITGASWVDGKYVKALSFDGDNDYVEMAETLSLRNLTEFTWMAWINLTAANIQRMWISKFTKWTYVKTDRTIRANVGAATTAADSITTNLVTLGQYTHVCITYSDSGDRKIRIYINGVEASYSTQTAAVGALSDDSSKPVMIGSYWNLSFDWQGIIDEVRIYNQALSIPEIENIYNNYGDPTLEAGKICCRVWADSTITLWGTVETFVEISGETALAVGFVFALIAVSLAAAAFSHRR